MILSAYCSSHETPTCDSPMFKGSFFLEKSFRRNLARIVASPAFYGENRQGLDTVTIKNDAVCFLELPKNPIPVLLAQALRFSSIPGKKTKCYFSRDLTSDLTKSGKCCYNTEKKYYLFQYLEILQSSKHSTDKIDKKI